MQPIPPVIPSRVLVVDDCRDTTAALALLLTHWGHEVCTAAEGQAALEVASHFQPNVVLLDISLPGMSGFELARRLRRSASPRPLLIGISGYSREEDRHRAMEAGCDCYLVKPIEPEVLQHLLEKRLGQKI